MSAFKAPLDPSTVLGGFSGNDYSGASAFIVTYPVNNAVDKEGNGTRKASAFKGTTWPFWSHSCFVVCPWVGWIV
ncbi:hypothetical protein LR48_Vigan10g198400 [Vigna angularis]|uniref:NPC1 middle luminal domain-containing protein n=1 Tax=Phaseolus angularis TaxID=3914 RepID=A0A0L9VMI0_PHAAN|nr:hypothetical protein LR48_Vigan10g198400 [Vigna angularis]